jgi:hypothetical protein
MNNFISGALALGYVVSGLFFLRFYRNTKDRLFAIFSFSFWLMAVHRVVVALASVDKEDLPYVYLLRLIAYLLIIFAIVDKNRAKAPVSGGAPTDG